MQVRGFLRDTITNEELIEGGDHKKGDTTTLNNALLVNGSKNSIKQYPTSCVGLASFIDDEGPDNLFREIRKEVVRDGGTITELAITGENKLRLVSEYTAWLKK